MQIVLSFFGGLSNSLYQLNDSTRRDGAKRHMSSSDIPTRKLQTNFNADHIEHASRLAFYGSPHRIQFFTFVEQPLAYTSTITVA